MSARRKKGGMARRFRGLLPIVVDIETTGLHPATDGLLEIAAVTLVMDQEGKLFPNEIGFWPVEPFPGARLDPEALAVTGIDPVSPLRYALTEQQALHGLFSLVRKHLAETECHRAVLVGHNAWFDLAFINAAIQRCGFATHPFHSFTTLDTASLAAVAYGETVLAKALRRANISFDTRQAHSAVYDASKTADLFCQMVNTSRWGMK